MAKKDGSLYYSGWSGLTYSSISAFNGRTIPSADQSSVTSLIKSLEDYICRMTGRQFGVLSEEDYYSELFTSGKNSYILKGFPIDLKKIVVGGVEVYVKGQTGKGYDLNVDFYVKNNRVVFSGGLPASGNFFDVEFQYNIVKFWGDDVAEAIKRAVSDIYLNKDKSGKGLNSFSFGGMSYSFKDEGITKMLDDVIGYYRVYLM